jgi:glucosamine kinase
MLGSELYFCVDGGGTKSRGRLYDAEGAALADAIDGPCNPATNLQVAVASIVALWRECCTAIGRDPQCFEGVVLSLGAAGTYVEAGRRTFLAACPPFARFCSVSDGYAALIGAGHGAPCGMLIAGTGVAAHRLYPNGLSIQRDAWGWIAGDRGGGSWMGQRALRHCLAAIDGVVPRDELSEAVFAAIGGIEGLRAGWMRNLGPDRLASLAPVVLEQANAGVAMAQRVRGRAVEHLAALTAVIASPDVPFYAAGGLITRLRTLLSEKTGLPILEPESDALRGCWLVATGKAPQERSLLFGQDVEHS